jgi:hypothetical protein
LNASIISPGCMQSASAPPGLPRKPPAWCAQGLRPCGCTAISGIPAAAYRRSGTAPARTGYWGLHIFWDSLRTSAAYRTECETLPFPRRRESRQANVKSHRASCSSRAIAVPYYGLTDVLDWLSCCSSTWQGAFLLCSDILRRPASVSTGRGRFLQFPLR